jgi:hypothetical protein
MTQRLTLTSIASLPRLLLSFQEQLSNLRADPLEQTSRLPLLRLAVAVLVALLALGTAGGLLAAP